MKAICRSALILLVNLIALLPITSNSEPEKIDEFSLGYVTKSNYKELNWEDFRRIKKSTIKRGVVDGFLSVVETSPHNYRICLYETLEALEYDRPRRSFEIAADLFREGLSLEVRQKNYTIFNKKWVKIYGVFEYFGRNAELPLANVIKCDSVEWRNGKNELVRTLDK